MGKGATMRYFIFTIWKYYNRKGYPSAFYTVAQDDGGYGFGGADICKVVDFADVVWC